jgi:hypothetical protein
MINDALRWRVVVMWREISTMTTEEEISKALQYPADQAKAHIHHAGYIVE